ncbi:MAG: stage III sporulation protein AE [Peptococcaceae bacterium BRH_c4b]|nr:MAG: stage III sporulation protein AE [Peptococcaceae bacterium BRH_c4b]
MTRLTLLLFLAALLFLIPGQAMAETEQPVPAPGLDEQMHKLDMEEIDRFINSMDEETQKSIPGGFSEIVSKLVHRDFDWKPADVFRSIMAGFFREIVANSALLGKLVVLAIICAVLQNLSSAFERGGAGQLTYMVTYLVLVVLAMGSFALAVNASREVVDKMVTFMQALLPVLLTLLVAVGGFASAAIFQPVLFVSLTVIGTLIKNIVLPLIFLAAVLGIAGNLSPRLKLSNMAGLLKTVAMGILGIFTTVFLGLLAIQGVAGAVGDGVTLRVIKFSTDAFIPVVGGMFSDALEAIVSSSLLIKNAVGIAGVVVVVMLMALPLLKILCLAFIYKLAGAMIQPVGDGQVVDCLNDLGSSLISVFAAVSVVGLMFFFAITVVVAVGNFTVMLR